MKILTRPLAFIAVVTAAAILVSGLVVVGSALAAPPVTVALHAKEDGVRLWVPVPSLWLTTAARIASIESHLDRLDDRHRIPLADVERLLDVLAGAEDATLVRVESEGELVEIGKSRKRLTVHVRSSEADVDVAVPIATLRSLVGLVEGRG